MHFINDFTERWYYAIWVKKFSARIREVTENEDVLMAELEIWDFKVTGPFFNWRKFDPVDAASASLSHYADRSASESSQSVMKVIAKTHASG
ncbi:TPA: hypothetical protein H1Q11_005052 [Salmonella enterica]|nr:hypothetical protein [Salmonella enterica]